MDSMGKMELGENSMENEKLDLEDMFRDIKYFHKNLGYDFSDFSDKEKMQAIRDISLALYQEVGELVESFPWKPWRNIEDQSWDLENAKREIIDCFFFIGKIMEVVNINPQELVTKFKEVLKNNYDRIENGYTNKLNERR